MTVEATARRALDWLFAASRDQKDVSITLFGGEPLLNKRVFPFVMEYSQELARKTGKSVHYTMTTNGTLLDERAIEYIKRHNFGLMVSLDGPPSVQDEQRPTRSGSGSFSAS